MTDDFFRESDYDICLPSGKKGISIDKANWLLRERGKAVMAHAGKSTNGLESPIWIAKPWQDADSTHTALLIGITKIKTEKSWNQLAREFISLADSLNSDRVKEMVKDFQLKLESDCAK